MQELILTLVIGGIIAGLFLWLSHGQLREERLGLIECYIFGSVVCNLVSTVIATAIKSNWQSVAGLWGTWFLISVISMIFLPLVRTLHRVSAYTLITLIWLSVYSLVLPYLIGDFPLDPRMVLVVFGVCAFGGGGTALGYITDHFKEKRLPELKREVAAEVEEITKTYGRN